MTAAEPLVGILMGSASDLEQVRPCLEALAELEVPHEVAVMSAHRTPQRVAQYAGSARERGLRVLVAAAGWAAHLPGVVAAYTTLPVIGLPIGSSPLGGQDALYAIVQMPPGIPVATVGINSGRNAAILAAEMLAMADETLAIRLGEMRQRMAARVEADDERVRREVTPGA